MLQHKIIKEAQHTIVFFIVVVVVYVVFVGVGVDSTVLEIMIKAGGVM